MVFLPPRKRWGLGQLLGSSTLLVGGKSSTIGQKHQHFLFAPLMGREEEERCTKEPEFHSKCTTSGKKNEQILEFLPGVFGF